MNEPYKFLILVFIFYSAKAFLKRKDYGSEFMKIADECHDICIDVCGTTEDAIQQVANGNFVNDEKVERYIHCLWRVSKVMDRNLVINKTLLDHILPKKELADGFGSMAQKCLTDAKNPDIKEKYKIIYELEKCLYKQNPEDFLMP